jgi:hypothetical protein
LASSGCGAQGGGGCRVQLADAGEQADQVVSGESPVEGFARLVVAVFEGGETVADLVEVGEVVGGDDFALDDGEDDLD